MTVALIKDGAVIEYRPDDAVNVNQGQLAPGKPYLVPVVLQNATFDPVTQVREEPPQTIVESTRVLWVYTVRPKTAAEVEAMRNNKIAVVRIEATKRLDMIVTLTQQIQALTRLTQMVYANTDRSAWPAQQQTLANTMLSRLNRLQQVRSAEDDKVTELQALTDPAAINAYDPAANWPVAA